MADFDDNLLKNADLCRKYADDKHFDDLFSMFIVGRTYVPNFKLIGSLLQKLSGGGSRFTPLPMHLRMENRPCKIGLTTIQW